MFDLYWTEEVGNNLLDDGGDEAMLAAGHPFDQQGGANSFISCKFFGDR